MVNVGKARLFAVTSSVFLSAVLSVGQAQAQALYQPYYYDYREQFQTMGPTNLSAPRAESIDTATQPNYIPDPRLNAQTNKRLEVEDSPMIAAPVKPRPVPVSETMPMTTEGGISFGLQGYHYQYEEPTAAVHITGDKLGINPAVTVNFGDQKAFFANLDFRYTFGGVDYKGSGTLKNESDDMWELRGLLGRDFTWHDKVGLASFTGFGYRHLYNDGRGTTTTGALGYRRESEYLYIPIGIAPKFRLDGDSRIAGIAEFDYFVHGVQRSYFSDVSSAAPDISNQQNSGYGIRASLAYERGGWSIGPFINYWKSQASRASFLGGGYYVYEPTNRTEEYGAQLKYRFVTF